MPRVRVQGSGLRQDGLFGGHPPPDSSSRESSLRRLDRLQRNLIIDRGHLERACVEQPDLLYQVAEQVAMHRSRRDAVKKELEEKEAALYITLRHQASVREERVTEAEIRAQMTTDRFHKVLTNQLVEANELLSRWEVLKEAFSQRSYMLKELVSLYLSRYYGDPARQAENRMRDVASERYREARRDQHRNGRREEEYN